MENKTYLTISTSLCDHVILTISTDSSARHILVAINIISIIIAAPGNVLTCIVIAKVKNLRKEASYILIGSVSLADSFVALVTQPLYISALMLDRRDTHCYLYNSLFAFGWMSSFSSILGINMITIDRYLYIVYPLRYQCYMTRKRALLLALISWICGASIAVVSLVWFSTLVLHSACLAHTTLSCLLVLVSYMCVYNKVKESNQQQTKRLPSSANECRQSQATKTVVTIIFVFFGCWAPWTVLSFIVALEEAEVGTRNVQLSRHVLVLQTLFLTFGFMSSAFNVFIYTLKNKMLKRELTKFVFGKKDGQLSGLPISSQKDRFLASARVITSTLRRSKKQRKRSKPVNKLMPHVPSGSKEHTETSPLPKSPTSQKTKMDNDNLLSIKKPYLNRSNESIIPTEDEEDQLGALVSNKTEVDNRDLVIARARKISLFK